MESMTARRQWNYEEHAIVVAIDAGVSRRLGGILMGAVGLFALRGVVDFDSDDEYHDECYDANDR